MDRRQKRLGRDNPLYRWLRLVGRSVVWHRYRRPVEAVAVGFLAYSVFVSGAWFGLSRAPEPLTEIQIIRIPEVITVVQTSTPTASPSSTPVVVVAPTEPPPTPTPEIIIIKEYERCIITGLKATLTVGEATAVAESGVIVCPSQIHTKDMQ